jgi:hypothetical protein
MQFSGVHRRLKQRDVQVGPTRAPLIAGFSPATDRAALPDSLPAPGSDSCRKGESGKGPHGVSHPTSVAQSTALVRAHLAADRPRRRHQISETSRNARTSGILIEASFAIASPVIARFSKVLAAFPNVASVGVFAVAKPCWRGAQGAPYLHSSCPRVPEEGRARFDASPAPPRS